MLYSGNSFCFFIVFKDFLAQETAPKVIAKPACTAESAEEGEAAETDVEANPAETLPPMIPDLSQEPLKAKLAYTDESAEESEAVETDVETKLAEIILPMLLDLI